VDDGWPGAHSTMGNHCEREPIPVPERRTVRTTAEAQACVPTAAAVSEDHATSEPSALPVDPAMRYRRVVNGEAPSTQPTTKKLFISHATADKGLVEGFVRLLESGVGVPPTCIFCTSMPGSRIPSGVNFREAIGREASQSEYIVALITTAFMKSPFCWSELGAGWVLGGRLKPFVVDPVTYSSVASTVIGDLQCLRFVAGDLSQFRDELSSLYRSQIPTDRWEYERDRFLSTLVNGRAETAVSDVQVPAGLAGDLTVHGTKQAPFGGRTWAKRITWQQAFRTVAHLIDSRNELLLRASFASLTAGMKNGTVSVDDPDWTEIMLRLNLSNLVVSQKRPLVGGGFQTFCSLTDEGRKLLNALQQSEQSPK
jgi:hypothetical protein